MWVRCVRGAVAAFVVCVVCATALTIGAHTPAGAAPMPPPARSEVPMQDADGDGMDDIVDLDDDNDGTPDNADPAPLDPTDAGAQPTPGPLDANQDTDSDGIPNILDPDDDSDTTPDNEDPAPLNPAPETPAAPEPTPAPGPDPAPAPSDEPPANVPFAPEPVVAEGPLVQALPVTGHGSPRHGGGLALAAVMGLLTLTLVCWIRVRRPIGT